MCKLLAHIH